MKLELLVTRINTSTDGSYVVAEIDGVSTENLVEAMPNFALYHIRDLIDARIVRQMETAAST